MYSGISSLNPRVIRKLYTDEKYTVKEISDKLDVSFWQVYSLMDKYNIARRNRVFAGFVANKNKPQFQIKSSLTLKDNYLKIAGVMLYWAEGTFLGNTVDFANSNPEMIKIFLRFMREICGVKEERLRLYLYFYTYQDIDKLKQYWHKVTGIPINQFTKPFIRRGNLNLSKRKLPYGLVHIRYNDKRLLLNIKSWLDEYILKWAGT